MAKSARASTKKSNRTKLRARVFRPIEDARTQRLSAKLMALASQPQPDRLDAMEVESSRFQPVKTHQNLASLTWGAASKDLDKSKPQENKETERITSASRFFGPANTWSNCRNGPGRGYGYNNVCDKEQEVQEAGPNTQEIAQKSFSKHDLSHI